MSFPNINFKITNAEVDENLKIIAENKLSTLSKFIGEAHSICDLEFEKITNHHNQGNIHRVEINLQINGDLHRTEATDETFEKALDKAKEELWNKLQSVQGKRETLFKRGARKIKEMMIWNR